MKKKTKYKYSFEYWQAFVIPLVIMVAGCIVSGIFPFGNRSFLRNDLYNQYMPFFQALHDRIRQGEGISYSFQLGLGSGFAALYGYYLASPINWLVVLWPRDYIAEFITLLILCKIGLAGMSFAYYLRKRFGKTHMGILLFSTAYALSGFMAAYQWNIMWLDVIVLAPLVLQALEELIKTGKGTKYCLFLALSIYTNFYLSIMLCIFLVLYFVVTVIWETWSVMWRSCFKFGFYSLLAGGMAAGMLIPVYFALSGTEFHEVNFPDKVKWYMNILEELSRHCINVSMKVQADHWPNIYCGVAIFLFVPLFIFNRKISWKDKISKIALTVFFLLSFSCNMLDFIWHGFNYPDSLPARQGYLYTWLLLVMAYEVYIHLKEVRLFEIILAAVFGYGVVISAWILTDVEGTDVWTYVLTLGFMTLYFLLLVGRYAWRYPNIRKWIRSGDRKALFKNGYLGFNIVLLVIVVVELAANTYLTSIRTVNRTKYLAHFEDAEGSIDWMKAQDDGLYRTEIFDRLTKNDSMMWDINTTTIFSSTIHAGIVDFYKAVGLGTTRVSYWYQGATPLVSAMLGVKYMVGTDDAMDNDLYDVVYTDETGCLYENNYTLPIGYVLDKKMEEEWSLSVYNPVKAQNEFCHLLGISGDLLVPIESTKEADDTYTIAVEADSYVYVYLGKNSLSEVKATKGNQTTKFTQVSFDYLLDIGEAAKDTTIKVETVKENQNFKTFEAYALNMRVLQEAIDIMSKSTLQVTEHGENYVKGNISLEEEGMLVLSIPMEKGWTLYVNGEETPIETFKNAFIAKTLQAGTYDIELRFTTPGWKEGVGISIACIALFAGCVYLERKKKNSI